ncbi:NAD(P)H-dependent oxidoreductase [Rhodococcus sp. T2V]|uniref:flavodoxin family protein n=1 Tax=Rhodococcus sp. T2V TaxID=3034164 RepID=UPI0023E2E0E5|nr:NAD(P)H-dependent oxidoreductase [Rhodococcus sp. T2V]MDF3312020.1 NAD(P)H-dependent oxidoreductase [Rhodococcus sp. T2V]
MTTLTALALTCSLKPSPAPSSSDLIADQVLTELASHEVTGDKIRLVDYDIRPGVEADMGDGDQWPQIRRRILDADILLISTPTWLGQMSSIAKRALERLDAELSVTDDQERPILFDKVAIAAVVGNEDGAHAIVASLFQALNDCGFSIPAQGCTYWNGEAMTPGDYNDLDTVPEAVAATNATAARNAAHLAQALRTQPYPTPH